MGGPHTTCWTATGRPAFTGVVQATALAPTALEAEVRAKAAVLSGPAGAMGWLSEGGVAVFDDGSHEAHAPARSRAGEQHLQAVGLTHDGSGLRLQWVRA